MRKSGGKKLLTANSLNLDQASGLLVESSWSAVEAKAVNKHLSLTSHLPWEKASSVICPSRVTLKWKEQM